jgi:hypothetical protein
MEVAITDVDIVKWWGATVATIALGWNIISYLLNAPKVIIRLTYPICFLDDRVLNKTVEAGNSSTDLATYCLVEIINRGKVPTTVSKIEASVTSKDKANIHFSAQSFHFHEGVTLPKALGVGEMISCRLESDKIKILEKSGTVFIKVYSSQSDKPTIKKLITTIKP